MGIFSPARSPLFDQAYATLQSTMQLYAHGNEGVALDRVADIDDMTNALLRQDPKQAKMLGKWIRDYSGGGNVAKNQEFLQVLRNQTSSGIF